jgi:hypothetical protein
MDDPQSSFNIIHTLWTAAITVGGGIVAFFTKRLIDDVDQKADKDEVVALKADLRAYVERQDRHHQSNTDRLDQILLTLSDRRDRRESDHAGNRR